MTIGGFTNKTRSRIERRRAKSLFASFYSSWPFFPCVRSLRSTSSCSWDYNGGVGSISGIGSISSGTPGSSGSAEDRNSMADTIASSSTSRASTGSRMLRSTTVDEDDGWSTDFSLSDEEMGSETYLDHVEVSCSARVESHGLTFSQFLLA